MKRISTIMNGLELIKTLKTSIFASLQAGILTISLLLKRKRTYKVFFRLFFTTQKFLARGTVQKIVLAIFFIILLVIIVLALVNMNRNTCSGDDCNTPRKVVEKIFKALEESVVERLNKPDQPGNYRRR